MLAKRIQNETRILGKMQGYIGLSVRDTVVTCVTTGSVRAMQTAWEPTPRELELLNQGAPVILTILGTDHPPVLIETGTPPGDE